DVCSSDLHHENEIAQSMCAHPEADFARVWMHNEMLQVEGRKMSKSLGNFFTVRDLLDKGVPGEVIRFVFLQTHYSKPMDWTEKKREEAEYHLGRWFAVTEGVAPDISAIEYLSAPLKDDLNTAGFLARMHEFGRADAFGALKAGMQLIGFPNAEERDWWRVPSQGLSADG